MRGEIYCLYMISYKYILGTMIWYHYPRAIFAYHTDLNETQIGMLIQSTNILLTVLLGGQLCYIRLGKICDGLLLCA